MVGFRVVGAHSMSAASGPSTRPPASSAQSRASASAYNASHFLLAVSCARCMLHCQRLVKHTWRSRHLPCTSLAFFFVRKCSASHCIYAASRTALQHT